jgi:hypothetical protein
LKSLPMLIEWLNTPRGLPPSILAGKRGGSWFRSWSIPLLIVLVRNIVL